MTVGSVSKAIAIMRHLAAAGSPQGVNAVARAIGIAPSSCFNILKTLADETMVRFDARSKCYSMDADLVPPFLPKQDLTEWFDGLRAELHAVARSHLLSCGLWEVKSGRATLDEVFDSPDPTRVYLALGQRLPSHIGAMGRCIAAHEKLSREDVARVVSELRWQSPPSAQAFWRDMQHAAAHGWAMDRSNYIRGLTTLAAPICDANGRVIFCLTGTGFDGQHDAEAVEATGARLASIAASATESRAKLLAG